MRINVTQIKHEQVEIEIDEFEVINAYIEVVCKEYNLRKDYFIRDNQLVYEDEDNYGWYSSFSTKVVRELTERDMEGVALLMGARKLRAELYNSVMNIVSK